MGSRIRYTATSILGMLVTGSMLALTTVSVSAYGAEQNQNTDMQKKHASCEHMHGQKQIDCEKRMTDMDKKNQPDASSIPTTEDKKPPNTTPPK